MNLGVLEWTFKYYERTHNFLVIILHFWELWLHIRTVSLTMIMNLKTALMVNHGYEP
jgi:hypothetical protein